VQFLAHLTGSGLERHGPRDHSMTFSGIRAEKLRHVDVLLHEPWATPLTVERSPTQDEDDQASDRRGSPAKASAIDVRIVNPQAYLAQKLLTLASRSFDRRGKALLYVFDTLALFGDALDELGAQAHERVPGLDSKRQRAARLAVEKHCQVDATAIRQAALIAREQRQRPPSKAQLAAAIRRNLPRVLPHVLDGRG